MSERVVVLGAGFGGLELSTMLSEAGVEAALVDRSDAFFFGYSKLDVMFGRTSREAARLPYDEIAKPGLRMLRETVTAIDPHARHVTTDAGVHEADHLVIALGADYGFAATPGLAEHGEEFYSVAGAERLAGIVRSFSQGHAIVGVCGPPFKCPPAPSECALLLHDALAGRGLRDACEISFVITADNDRAGTSTAPRAQIRRPLRPGCERPSADPRRASGSTRVRRAAPLARDDAGYHAGRPPRNKGQPIPPTRRPSRRSSRSCASPASSRTIGACAR